MRIALMQRLANAGALLASRGALVEATPLRPRFADAQSAARSAATRSDSPTMSDRVVTRSADYARATLRAAGRRPDRRATLIA